MREIKFRGKRLDNGEWVYGLLFELSYDGSSTLCIGTEPLSANDYSEIYKSCYDEVDTSTVGQYTGLKDKNGKEIYEGDIVEYIYQSKDGVETKLYIVVYGLGCFYCQERNGAFSISVGYYTTLKNGNGLDVAGNIYENPELLKE